MDAAAANPPGGRQSTRATSTVTETESLLSKLGQGYKRAKAQQILRLLADQESLNQRFKDCALNEDEDDDDDEDGTKDKADAGRRNSSDGRSNSPIGGVWVKRGLTLTSTAAEEERRENALSERERERRQGGYLAGSGLTKAAEATDTKHKQKKKKVASAVDPSRCRLPWASTTRRNV
ncbi:hypothetical protein PoB_003389100 [Plakobranchus ocellatus]|uniref:Uncharacterized protein n=1 Tax=Plakobranchus ocellatus TaxID=259542 RepID=A0AAV4AGG9_9GAST|nr:hypothetical protein PoB_003389100 [Plakobranchus ocellatus]